MKKLFLIAALVFGASYQAYANDYEDDMAMDHEEEVMEDSSSEENMKVANKRVAMTAKAARAACKKEGKKGKSLASCIKTRTATH